MTSASNQVLLIAVVALLGFTLKFSQNRVLRVGSGIGFGACLAILLREVFQAFGT